MGSGNDLLSHGETPHYHRRGCVSLLSSGWIQVVPQLYCHQTNSLLRLVNCPSDGIVSSLCCSCTFSTLRCSLVTALSAEQFPASFNQSLYLENCFSVIPAKAGIHQCLSAFLLNLVLNFTKCFVFSLRYLG